MKINKNSLQARIKNLSTQKSVSPNIILQEFFFDAFLKRLAKSKYKDNFVFKGGFLLSATLGIEFRSTMDMDFLFRNLAFSKENVIGIIKEIIKEDVEDNVSFDFDSVRDIRPDDQYGGYNINLIARLENIKVPVSVDIATGDPITPSSIVYNYKCLFSDDVLNFNSYNFETILAEKLHTILNREENNSRSKDYYDIYIIQKLRFNEINLNQLKLAFKNTCSHRDFDISKEKASDIVNKIKHDDKMIIRWNSYVRKNKFASGISFAETISAVENLLSIIF